MEQYQIALLWIFGTPVFGWLLLSLVTRYSRYRRFGKIIYKGIFYSSTYRKKDSVDFPYDVKLVDKCIRNVLVNFPKKYTNTEILNNIECIFMEDLVETEYAPVDAYGSARPYHYRYDYLTFSRIREIFIDVDNCEYAFSKDLIRDEEQFSKLWIHEYCHHMLMEDYGDSDHDHTSDVWKLIR